MGMGKAFPEKRILRFKCLKRRLRGDGDGDGDGDDDDDDEEEEEEEEEEEKEEEDENDNEAEQDANEDEDQDEHEHTIMTSASATVVAVAGTAVMNPSTYFATQPRIASHKPLQHQKVTHVRSRKTLHNSRQQQNYEDMWARVCDSCTCQAGLEHVFIWT